VVDPGNQEHGFGCGPHKFDLADPSVRYSGNIRDLPAPTSQPGGHFELFGIVQVRVERCEGFTSCGARWM